MPLNKSVRAAVAAALLVLFSAFLLPGAETANPRALPTFGAGQRLPLPETIEVTSIASADRSIWFSGIDHTTEPGTGVVFSWSFDGIRQYTLPPADGVTATAPVIAVSRSGQAILLQGGRLYSATDFGFAPLQAPSAVAVSRITARDGFWVLTSDNDVYYLPAPGAQAAKLAHSESEVTALVTNAADDLWYASADGKLTLVKRDGSTGEKLSGPTDVTATALYADANEQLWVAYSDGRVARYVGGSVDWFSSDEGLPGGAASQIAEDGYGNLLLNFSGSEAETAWIMTQPRGLRTNLSVQFRRYPMDGLNGAVRAVAVDHLGGAWVSVGTKGAFRLQGLSDLNWPRGFAPNNRNDGAQAITQAGALAASKAGDRKAAQATLSSFPVLPGGKLSVLNSSKGLPKDIVSCIATDNLKNVYFTTGYYGFGTNADPDDSAAANGGVVVKYDHRTFTTLALPAATGYQACAWDAATSSVWFGGTNGLSKYTPSTNAVASFLTGQTVMKVIVRGSSIYAATLGGTVYQLSTATGDQQATFTVPGGLRLTSIAFDSGGTLYAGVGIASGTINQAVYRWNGSAFVAESQNLANAAYVHDIEFDNNNNLWVAQRYGPIWRRTPANVWTSQTFGPQVSGFYRAYRIIKDPAGNLWFTHYNFGAVGSPNAGATFIPAAQVSAANPTPVYYGTGQGLPGNAITFVAQENGAYWFGSPGGGAWRVGGPFDSPGFPKALTGYPQNSSPVLVDLDNDGKLDIVTGDSSGRIYAFKSDGSSLWTVDVSVSVPALPQQTRAGVVLGSPFGHPSIDSSVAVGDVDGDGEIEIVVGTGARTTGDPGTPNGQGGVVIISRTGTVKRFLYTQDIRCFPDTCSPMRQDGYTEPVFATPLLANVDGDPELEILVGAFDNLIYGWNGDGTPIYQNDEDNDGRFDEDGLGDTTPMTPFDTSDDAPGIRNVDDDGDGTIDEGPAADDDEDGLTDEDYPQWPFLSRDTTFASAAAWDLNGDGQKEIIFGHDASGGVNQEFARGGVLRVLTPQGTQAAGFPKGNLEQVIWSSPVVVDLDNDGSYEIIHGTGFDLGAVANTPQGVSIGQLVHAWRANGQPYIAGNANGKLATTEGRTFASFAVGDLDNDGSPELVIMTSPLFDKNNQFLTTAGQLAPNPQTDTGGQKLYVFDTNGNVKPGFPVRPYPFFANATAEGSPILVDVDNDGYLDIVIPVRKGPIVFDRTGHVLPAMGPFEALEDDTGARSMNTTAAYADIDNDGVGELVWTVPATDDIAGTLKVVKLGAMNESTYQRSWPQWRRTVNRNGVFGAVISLVQSSESANVLTIRAQAFAGRNALASVQANLSAIGGSATAAMTGIGNSYFSVTQNVAALAAGRYEIPVTISDAVGRTDSQTLVYIRKGGAKALALSSTSLNFGSTTQGVPATRQLTMTNIGTQVVRISSITASGTEFVPNVQNSAIQLKTTSGMSSTINGVPFGVSWAGPLMPKDLQPGESFSVQVRFRPSASAGNHTSSLTITSDAPSVPAVALSGSTSTGAVGCSTTTNPSGTRLVDAKGAGFDITVSPSVGGCQWNASVDVSWVSIFNDRPGNKIVTTVYPNLTVQPRTARLNVNGTVLIIHQNGSTSLTEDQRFVALLYFAFFGRYPKDEEMTLQMNFLGTNPDNTRRLQLINNFLNSPEFNNGGRYIAGLYVGLLNRDAEYAGWVYQRNALSTNLVNQPTLVRNFIISDEYNLSHPNQTRPEYVQLLYNQVLLRTAAPDEITLQVNEINRLVTVEHLSEMDARSIIGFAVLVSPEFQQKIGPRVFAFLLSALFLQRDPTPAEFNAFKNALAADPTVLPSLVLQQITTYEYRRLLI